MTDIQIKSASTVETVCSALENDIFSYYYMAGAKITENELASRYKVSRNTVREAIAYLLSNGLLEKVANKGVYVRRISSDDIREIFHLRELLEREAIQSVTASGVISLDLIHLCEQIDNIDPENEWNTHVEADIAFHQMLVRSAESSRLMRLYDTILAEVKLCIFQSHTLVPIKKENAAQHMQILKAIEAEDLPLALDLLSTHIESAIKNYESCFLTQEQQKK